MTLRISLIALLFLAALMPARAFSQIYDCQGTYTNRPCQEGEGRLVFEEKPFQPLSSEQTEKHQKETWIRELESARFRVKKEYGIDVSIASAIETCGLKAFEDCLTAVQAKESEINQIISEQAKALRAGQNGKEKTDAPKNIAISIVQQQTLVHRTERRPPKHQPGHGAQKSPPPSSPVNSSAPSSGAHQSAARKGGAAWISTPGQ